MCASAEVLGYDGDHPNPPCWISHPLHLRGVRRPLPGAHAWSQTGVQTGRVTTGVLMGLVLLGVLNQHTQNNLCIPNSRYSSFSFFFIGKCGKKVKIKKYSSNINEAKFLITVDVQFQGKEKFHCVILAFDAWKLSSFHTAQLMLLLLDTGRMRNVS